MLYPMKFKPLFKDYIWGGRNLEKYGKILPDGIIAESWELSCEKDGMSIIKNGKYKNHVLLDVIIKNQDLILGEIKKTPSIFYLLFKIIDANSKLSIQVHPNDKYAYEMENGQLGKTKLWYIIWAKPDAKIVFGFNKNLSEDEIMNQLRSNNHKNLYNEVPVNKGDVIFVPPGTVNAIYEGIILTEIQHSSNLTYRLYDYDRVDSSGKKRLLHIEKAIDVLDFNIHQPNLKGISINKDKIKKRILALSKYFYVEEIQINDSITIETNNVFNVIMALEGKGKIYYSNKEDTINFIETMLIPAKLDKYKIQGKVKFLRIYIPNINTEVNRLIDLGISYMDIKTLLDIGK